MRSFLDQHRDRKDAHTHTYTQSISGCETGHITAAGHSGQDFIVCTYIHTASQAVCCCYNTGTGIWHVTQGLGLTLAAASGLKRREREGGERGG